MVVDIASNDGCALREFRKFGVRVVGVDPAKNLAQIATDQGIPTVPAFWNMGSAEQILAKYGQASFINAMNVFAHVDDLDQFLTAVNVLLKESGVFVIEVPYLLSFVNQTEFDTTYHEHLSYFLVKPLIKLLDKHDLTVFDIKQHTIHGGSIRVYSRKATNNSIAVDTQATQRLLELEKELGLHEATVTLHPEVIVTVQLNVARTEEEAEIQKQGKSIQELAAEEEAAAEFEIQELFDDIGSAASDDDDLAEAVEKTDEDEAQA